MSRQQWEDGLERLQIRLGYRFADPALLRIALTHRSWAEEAAQAGSPDPHNERLEFLGDAVVQIVVTHVLFTRFPGAREGQLSKMRSRLVDKATLAEVGKEVLDVGAHVRLGRGEESSGGRTKDRILANATEAVLGALYLDQGAQDAAQACLAPWLLRRLQGVDPELFGQDPKSELQTLAMRHFRLQPHYEKLGEDGPAHQRTFTMRVRIGELLLEEAHGRSKQEGEVRAAEAALERLRLKIAEREQAPPGPAAPIPPDQEPPNV